MIMMMVMMALHLIVVDGEIGGCVQSSGDSSYVPESKYSVSDPVQTTACDPFEKVLSVYGIILVGNSNPSSNNQAVTDDMMKWIAHTITEIFPSTATDLAAQQNVLEQMYKYKAAIPVFSPSMVDDMEPARNYLSMCDTISVGNPEFNENDQVMEIFEHLLHIISDVGLHYAYPTKWSITDTSSDLYAAMQEAIDAGIYDVSSYSNIGELAVRRRIQLQEFAYWSLSTVLGVHGAYFEGTAAPEWTLSTASQVYSQLPLFSALHNATTATFMAAPSTSTMNSLKTLIPSVTSDPPTWPIVSPGRSNANVNLSSTYCGFVDQGGSPIPYDTENDDDWDLTLHIYLGLGIGAFVLFCVVPAILYFCCIRTSKH